MTGLLEAFWYVWLIPPPWELLPSSPFHAHGRLLHIAFSFYVFCHYSCLYICIPYPHMSIKNRDLHLRECLLSKSF